MCYMFDRPPLASVWPLRLRQSVLPCPIFVIRFLLPNRARGLPATLRYHTKAGSDRRVLGPELPFRRTERQDPGGHRGRRVPAPRGAADPLLSRRADAGLAHRRKHRHRRRPSDAGD